MGVNEFISGIFNGIAFMAEKVNLLNVLDVAKIEPDSVWLDTQGKYKLYGCKIEGNSNRQIKLGNIISIANELKYKQQTSQIFIHYVKKSNFQAVYVYGFNKVAIRQISNMLNIEMFTGKELLISLFTIYHVGKREVTDENRLRYTEDENYSKDDFFIPWEFEMISGRFREGIKNSIEKTKKEFTHYQGVSFYNREIFEPEKLFLLNWEGTVSVRLDFAQNASQRRFEHYQKKAGRGDPRFFKVLKNIELHEAKTYEQVLHNSCTINIIATIKNEYEGIEQDIGELLSTRFEADYRDVEKIHSNSLMMRRNNHYDAIFPIRLTQQFFSSSHKKILPEKIFPFYAGLDISGNHIEYSPLENTSPHVLFTGRTGSGKSRQAIKGLLQTIGFDIDTGKALRFEDFRIRYTDVGFSFGNTANSLRNAYQNRVKIYPSKVTTLRFSLFDIEVLSGKVNKDELAFSVSIIAFALNIQSNNGETSLNGSEIFFLKQILTEMLITNVFEDIYINEFKKLGVYGRLLKDIKEEGYSESNRISDLPEKFNYLKKPILSDLIKALGVEKGKAKYSDPDKNTWEALETKIKMLRGYDFLTNHANTTDDVEQLSYVDFDEIKESPLDFSVIYWLLVRKWTQGMKTEAKEHMRMGTQIKPTLFFVDEAHNFFKYPAFVDVFTSASKEFRKFYGYITFLSQEALEIPAPILTQIGTKIFMTPPEERDSLKEIIKKVNASLKEEDSRVIDKITDYMMYISNDNGGMGMKFPTEGWEEKFFKPAPPPEAGFDNE